MTVIPVDDSDERVRRRDDSPVLRMSETEAALLDSDPDDPSDDERMIMNMGPSHPSTHGVLRLMLELEGDRAALKPSSTTCTAWKTGRSSPPGCTSTRAWICVAAPTG
jgi:hypothetical protein